MDIAHFQTSYRYALVDSSTADHKLKADCTLKYADLMGFKKDKIEKEEKRVRYYLPVKCDFCEFFKKYSVPQKEQGAE